MEEGVPLWWIDKSRPAPPSRQRNHKGALDHRDFVSTQIKELLKQGAINKVTSPPRVVNPLNVVPKKGGKLRLILDLRHVNTYLQFPKFKLESLKALESLAQPGDLMFALDLLSGYYQCHMHPAAWDYLGLEWEGSFYIFCVLPFGLASAPWVFTKFMREVASGLRAKGIRLLVYLDDWLCLVKGSDLPLARTTRTLILNTLRAAGLTINTEKSHLDFTPSLHHLGFIVDLSNGIFIVPEGRWTRLQELVAAALQSGRVSVRHLSRISGHIVSMSLALGRLSRLFTRVCYLYQGSHSPNFFVSLGDDLREELKFWQGKDRNEFTSPVWRPASVAELGLDRVASDAGGEAWGAVLGNHKAHGYFPLEVRKTSSTKREMLAALFALHSFGSLLKGKQVQMQSDNQAVPRIITNGSRHPPLNFLALEIFWCCQLLY